ncbi:MAG: hypothetical protein ABSE82_05090 [Nitrososphaerales archaeon]
MNQVKKDQFTAVAMLALLLLLTSVMVVNLDKFSSPAATSFGEVIGIAKNPSNAKGLLVVNVETNLTLLPKSSGSVEVGNQGLLDEPVRDLYVSVSNIQNGSRSVSNLTNTAGQVVFSLASSKYEVEFVDWRLNFTKVSVEVLAGEITSLRAYVNATGFFAQSFNIIDQYSSNYALSWEQVYIQVSSEQIVTGVGANTFIATSGDSLATVLNTGNFTDLTSASIVGSLQEENFDWVNVQVGSPVPIQSIQSMQLLLMNVTFKVESS